MTHKVKLFLPNDFYEEVLYQFEGKDADLRKLIFSFLTPIGKQARMSKLNGSVQCRFMKEGKTVMEDVELKDIDLEKHAPKSIDTWIPSKVTIDEIKIYELSVSERLYKDLTLFGKIWCARLQKWNDSLDPKSNDYKTQVATQPACIEQILQDNVVTQLSKTVSENIEKDYQEEFIEIEKKIPKPPTRDKPKK